jgi:myosin heavy subunit
MICGASNTNYLLEKSRVVFQMANERNYHIFYQLCRGLKNDPKQFAQYRLNDVNSFYYLNQSGCTDIDGVSDEEEFEEVQKAMSALDFSAEEISSLFTVTAGVLHIGNMTFEAIGDRQCSIQDKTSVENVSKLLQVNADELQNVCTTRRMVVTGQAPITIGLSSAEASSARDALAKFIYEKQFDWLVDRINQSIGRGNGNKNMSIGILDIFGFEIFKKNSFEQLCINFTNEKLQQFFNQYTFKKEELLYQSENIKFDHISYIDNQPVLDLIENKPSGLLPLLDEEVKMPKGSDKSWMDKLIQVHSSNSLFARDKASSTAFVVKHYAGDVCYEHTSFLEKNKDMLNDDASALLSTSSFSFLSAWFPIQKDVGGQFKKATLGAKFTKQLGDLMATLNATEPHYVRCIKPNNSKNALSFEGHMCLEQLQYAGVFEAIQIRKHGFPFRLSHLDFFQRYKCVLPQNHPWTGNHVTDSQKLLAEMGIPVGVNGVQIGRSRILYRAEQHRQMELKRNLAVEGVTVVIQNYLRVKLAKMLEQRCRNIRPVFVKALQSESVDEYDKALEQADSVGFKIKEQHAVERAKHIHFETIRLDSVLAILIVQDVQEFYPQFEEAVHSADEIALKTPNAERARQLYNEATAYRNQIAAAAETQLKVLDEHEMKEILEKADAISFQTDSIEKLRHLLYNTSEDAFVKMQLKAAVALKDKQRVTRTTIKLKDMFFLKSGDLFKFSRYPKLHPPTAWAELKFLPIGRQELAASMLRWTKTPIHAPMTQIPPENKVAFKAAKSMFKNIVGYMGDGKFGPADVLAAELLGKGLELKDIRTEIYCQLVKQLTQNPNSFSVQKGWDLMVLCLATFPPPGDFENYLEMYLRTSSPQPPKFVNQLHDTLYGGERRSPPNESEFASILAQAATNATRDNNARSTPASGSTSPILPQRTNASAIANLQPITAAAVSPVPPPPAPRAPVPPAAPSKPRVPEDTVTDWHYIDKSGNQNGPSKAREIKEGWRKGLVDGECIAWNPNLKEWTKVHELSDLVAYLNDY